MDKIMTTHELGKILLNSENKPLFIKEYYEVQGEREVGYSNIKGLIEGDIEDGYVIDVGYLEAEPNDNRYGIGDATVYLKEPVNELTDLEVDFEQVIYMLFHKGVYYHNWDFNKLGFFEDDHTSVDLLKPELSIVTKEGFHPERVIMSLEEAKEWYLSNLPEYVSGERWA